MTTLIKTQIIYFQQIPLIKLLKHIFSILLITLFFGQEILQAQCPPGLISAGAIEANGPITISDLGNCTGTNGMIRYNTTTMKFEGYQNGAWVALDGSGSGHWSLVGGSGPDIFNTTLDNVGIGINTPLSKLHVEDNVMSTTLSSAQKIDFGTSTGSIAVFGLDIDGIPNPTNQKGTTIGLQASTGSNYTLQTGTADGRLAVSKAFFGDGDFIGVDGFVSATALNNFNSLDTRLLGGWFRTQASTNVTLTGSNSNFWVGGVKAELQGTINNTPTNGAVAAVIGVDSSQGTAQSWAGYFEGNGHFSEKVILGSINIPTTAMGGSQNVSDFHLFVKGGVLTEQLIIDSCTNWADYVFEEDYSLNSLEEVEAFIQKVGHLPNTPSAEEVAENGLRVKEITIKQQEKIEELFLHSIALNKENKMLQSKNEDLKDRMAKIEMRMEALEQK